MGSQYSKEVEISKMVEELGPLQASAVVQTIGSNRHDDGSKEEGDTAAADVRILSQEHFLKVTILMKRLDDLSFRRVDKTHLIIAADTSGSMSGNPIKQVKIALEEIIACTISNSNMKTDLITFESTAKLVQMNSQNYKEKINQLAGGGGTSFAGAFKEIENQLRLQKDESVTKTVIVFLTDGQDSAMCMYPDYKFDEKWTKALYSGLDKMKKPYTIHTVGFSRDHSFLLLKRLTEAGSGDGMYRYCEPGDGPMVLKEKLQELFDFILVSSAPSVDLKLTMNDDNKFIVNGKMLDSCTLPGEITDESNSDMLQITGESWIYVNDPSCAPSFTIEVSKEIYKDKTLEVISLPCQVVQVKKMLLESVRDKILWNLRIITRNADILASKIGTAIAEKKDISQFGSRVDKIQHKVSKTPLFKSAVDKDTKEIIRRFLDEIQDKVTNMRSILADCARGDTQSVQILARAHDMRYQAKFSKSRRQRIMDKRVANNINIVKEAQEQLNSLQINKEDIEKISQNSAEFYFCALSQDSVKDILLSSDKENAIGFGLAVKRMEHVLDEPSVIRISNISGTLVSRTSMLDALEYKINCDGQLSAHGGFDFSRPLGVTTVGMGREPINAWLPLYCNKYHWDRVQVLIKPTLGYFCTLDPLGYDLKQLDVMFMVLGSMIGQLSEQNTGEHQIRLLLAFQRTCQAMMETYNLTNDCIDSLKNFRDTPEKRTKDIVPNLLTLVGFIVSLPVDKAKEAIGTEGDNMRESLRKFWLAYIAETVRRSAGLQLKDSSTNVINGLIELIVDRGGQGCTPVLSLPEAEARLLQVCQSQRLTKVSMPVSSFDPRASINLPAEMKVEHDEKMDKAMATWAQAQCGDISAKHQSGKVAAAKKAIAQWKKEGVDAVSIDVPEMAPDSEQSQEPQTTYDVSKVPLSVVEGLAKILLSISKVSYPQFGSIPGCIAFIEHYLTNNPQCDELEENDGIPPEEWITQIKSAVSGVYSCMNAYIQNMGEDKSDKTAKSAEGSETPQTEEDSDVCECNVVVPTTTSQLMTGKGSEDKDNKPDDDDLSESDNDDDDDDDDDYDDFDDDHDDYTRSARIKKKKRVNNSFYLPAILQIVAPDINIFQMTRSLLCQAVQIHSNSKARAAMKGDNFTDLSGLVDYDAEICKLHVYLQQMKESAIQDVQESLLWNRANQSMLKSASIWAFIGYLMNTYPDRNQGFSDLITMILGLDNKDLVPELAEKVRIMFLGKYQDYPVIAKGNVWIPESKMAKKFSQLLGEEVWSDIEMDVRSKVTLHVYRESDIPNRHGHCNSNPYIPNALRKKLGMPLLPRKK